MTVKLTATEIAARNNSLIASRRHAACDEALNRLLRETWVGRDHGPSTEGWGAEKYENLGETLAQTEWGYSCSIYAFVLALINNGMEDATPSYWAGLAQRMNEEIDNFLAACKVA